ncbi:MAG: carbon-nitrogen hydrolase family protein [Spirochaetota bacterium]
MKADMIVPWAPHPSAAPRTERSADRFVIKANGTRTCAGGWQLRYDLVPGKSYRIDVPVEIRDVAHVRESVRCLAIWGDIPPDRSDIGAQADNDALFFHESRDGKHRFSRVLTASSGILVIRYIFRWSTRGEASFGMPMITETSALPERRIRIAVVTGSHEHRHAAKISSVADNAAFYGDLCRKALDDKPDLIVLPEIVLQWGVAGNRLDRAVPLDHGSVRGFQAIAASGDVRILLPFDERSGDAVFNSAVLIGPGGIEGVYHKVHLAEYGETNSGITPGDSFPVFDTPKARIGVNICMDSSAAESSRMLGLNGTEVMCLPIMGDHRADVFSRGTPAFNEDRWKAIMRTRALDNQFVVAVARNEARGSVIIDTMGDIVAWNDGSKDIISADVIIDPVHRKWNGGRQRDIVYMQRRPQLYGAFTEQEPPVCRALSGY